MSVVQADTIEFIDTPNGNAAAAGGRYRRGASEVSVIRQRQAQGGFNPPHSHDREEVLILLAGALEVTVDGEARLLHAGDAIIVPARTDHQLKNAGVGPAEWFLVAPAGYRFFHASGEEAGPAWSR